MKTTRAALFQLLLVCTVGSPLAAQVGSIPERSPFRDVRVRQTATVFGGALTAGRGVGGVGPSEGRVLGLRYDFHVSGPVALFLGVGTGDFDRRLIDPTALADDRDLGNASQRINFFETGFNFILTGQKAWRGFSPYFGGKIGVVLGQSVPEDSSGFAFGTQFQVGPEIGVRYWVSRRVHLRLEGSVTFWRLSLPSAFGMPPLLNPAGEPVVDFLTNPENQWVGLPGLRFGFGFTTRF